jgi:hypothetical protein
MSPKPFCQATVSQLAHIQVGHLKKNEERLSQIPLSRIIFYIPIEFIAIWPISFYGNKDPFFLLVLLIFIRQV